MNDDDEDDKKLGMMPLGDMGTLGVALVFLVAFLWLMFGPSPFAGLFKEAKPAPAQPQEVTVTVPDKGK